AAETAEVDDAADAGLGAGVPERRRRHAIALTEVVARAHAVDEEVRRVHTGQRPRQCARVGHVTPHDIDLGGPGPIVQLGRGPGRAPDADADVEELGHQAANHIAGRTGHEHTHDEGATSTAAASVGPVPGGILTGVDEWVTAAGWRVDPAALTWSATRSGGPG